MIKVFKPNKHGKIEFTKKELEKLLDEVWKDGYNSPDRSYTWESPYYWYWPYRYYGPYYDTTTTPIVTWSSDSNSIASSVTYASSDPISYTGKVDYHVAHPCKTVENADADEIKIKVGE